MSDLSSKLAAAQNENNDGSAADFAPNETADGYLLFGNAKAIGAAINDALGIDKPGVNTWGLTRSDIPTLRKQGESEGWHPNATKWAIDAAMKSWLGDRQASENEGFGIGLEKNDDGIITGWYDEGYAAFFGATLPAVEHEQLDAEEVQALNGLDIDVDELGHNPDEVPVMPVFTTGRYPVFVDSYDDLDAAIEMLDEFPEEPSLGSVEREEDPDEVDVRREPGSLTVAELREHLDENEYSGADLEAMLAHERDGKDRVTAIDAIESAMDDTDDTDSSVEENRYAKALADGGPPSSRSSAEEKIEAFNNLVDDGVPAQEAAERVGL